MIVVTLAGASSNSVLLLANKPNIQIWELPKMWTSNGMPFEYESLRATTQHAVIDFLNAQLKIAHTFVQSALLSKNEGHVDHYTQAKHGATKAAESVPKFVRAVSDDKARTEITEQLTELDRLISEL